MTAGEFALFDTEIGRCAIVWSTRGVTGIQLPEGREAQTRTQLLRRFPDAREAAPSADVCRAIDAIAALLRGEPRDLSAVTLDMDAVPPFYGRVYDAARQVPPGATVTYGEIAAQLGARGSARAVGQALGRNPFAIVVPCHRVLAAGGRVGGFSANGGIATKLRLLAIESSGAGIAADLFEGDGALRFDPALAIAHARRCDPALARLIDTVGAFRMRIKKTRTLFVALAEAIVYQQLNGKAAATIYARVCALFPQAHAGPTPENLLRASEAKLRAAGLSGSKLLSLRDLARKTVTGEIPTLGEVHAMDDETVVERLTRVRGIGRWTVEMLLMFRLGRPDVLPIDDYGIRKGYAIAFGQRDLPTPKELAQIGARWQPYRTLVSWYLWRAVDLERVPPAASP